MSSNKFSLIQLILSIIFIIFLLNCSASLIRKRLKHFNETLRLPNHTIPLTYNLSFVIDDNYSEIYGLANIEIFIINRTNEIVLNAKNLYNFKIHLINLINGKDIPNINYNYNNDTNFLKIYSNITTNNDINYIFQNGSNLMLTIKYSAIINENTPKAVYKSTNHGSNNIVIATQFEPVFAREAFPCFDEPNFKARYILTLTHSSNHSALSNMPIFGEPVTSDDGLRKITKFQQTPLMSSYLLAFTLHDYFNVTTKINNITQSVYYSHPEDIIEAKYTLKKATEILTILENVLGFNYTLPKMDQIEVPISYGSAMENWGLITYEENKFLMNSECRTETDFQRIITMSHEMVHQWFGNLVSPKWWTYTWLNEGFATYYSYIVADLIYPECQIMDQRVIDSIDIAFAWPTNRPLTTYVEQEEEVKAVFDAISYHRAAFIIRMIQHTLGKSTFQKGIYNYLEKYQYSAVDEDSLFESFERAAQQDNRPYLNETGFMSKFLKTWTHNNGFPNLQVTRDYETGEITITQTPNMKYFTRKWYIPITFATTVNSNFDDTTLDYMMPPTRMITINPKQLNITLKSTDWLILNKKQIGLYHINYDKDNWYLIANALNNNHTQIDVSNRAQIIRDITSFLKPGSIDVATVLEIFSYLKYENELLPWEEAAYILYEMHKKLYGTKTGELFKYFVRDIVSTMYNMLQNSSNTNNINDVPLTETVRISVLDLACQVDYDDCLQYSYKQLKNYIETGDFMKSFTKSSNIICAGVRHATQNEFKIALEKILFTNNIENYDRLLSPLICSTDLINLKLLLNNLLDNLNLNQEKDLDPLYKIAFQIFSTNEDAQILILDFFIEHIDDFSVDWEDFSNNLGMMAIYMIDEEEQNIKYNLILKKISGNTTSELYEIEAFPTGMLARIRKKFIAKNDDDLAIWLTAYKSKIEINNSIN